MGVWRFQTAKDYTWHISSRLYSNSEAYDLLLNVSSLLIKVCGYEILTLFIFPVRKGLRPCTHDYVCSTLREITVHKLLMIKRVKTSLLWWSKYNDYIQVCAIWYFYKMYSSWWILKNHMKKGFNRLRIYFSLHTGWTAAMCPLIKLILRENKAPHCSDET